MAMAMEPVTAFAASVAEAMVTAKASATVKVTATALATDQAMAITNVKDDSMPEEYLLNLVRLDSLLDVMGPLFEQAFCLLDNVEHRDTPQWQAAAALLKAQLKEAVGANAADERHSLAKENR